MIERKKQIVFVEPFPTVMIYKIARLLKKKGYETVLIKLMKSGASEDFHLGGFDKVISFNIEYNQVNIKNIPKILKSFLKTSNDNLKAFLEVIKLRPYVVFARSCPSWPCAITRVFTRKAAFIYFPYDIRCQYYDSIKKARKSGIPSFEIKAERFCFENAEGVMHKGSPEELKLLNGRMLGDNVKLPRYQLNFLPYCLKEFILPINKNKLSKKDKEIHIAFVNSIGTAGPMSGLPVFENIKLFISMGIHVHVYSRPNSISQEQLRQFFIEDSEFTRRYSDVLKSKFFHLHNPVEPDKLSEELSQYDFGMWTADENLDEGDINLDNAIGNKLASYLEAGIGLVSHRYNKFINQVSKKYGILIEYDLGDKKIKELKKSFSKLNLKKLEKNVIKAREDFLMDKHIGELEQFMIKVAESKRISR